MKNTHTEYLEPKSITPACDVTLGGASAAVRLFNATASARTHFSGSLRQQLRAAVSHPCCCCFGVALGAVTSAEAGSEAAAELHLAPEQLAFLPA